MIKYFSFFILIALGYKAEAYPSYISYGYQSCLGCHFNPLGNGPLTDYGRVVSATELTDLVFYTKGVRSDDEKLANLSGFLFSQPKNDWFRPSASYRGLYYEVNPGQSGQKSQWIHMDASAALVAKFFNDDKLIFAAQISYAPTPLEAQGDGKTYASYRSRDTYVGYRPNKSYGLYAGLMDKAFGIMVPDHISYSRVVTHNTEDDQTYGVLSHLLVGKFEWFLQPFVGNFVQAQNLRQVGVTTQLNYLAGETKRFGVSVASSKSDFLSLTMYAVDFRSGFGKGNSLLCELGQVESTPVSAGKTIQRYVFLQNQWLVHRGLSTILSGEMLENDIYQEGETYRFGPGIQYFPIYRMELRADIYDTRVRGTSYSDDSWFITGQVHIWF